MSRIIKRTETLQVQVYEYLRNKILTGGLEPGQRIIEEKISEETGVSRSPIREAIRRLETDGLVKVNSFAQGGVTVYNPTKENFKYLYECRLSVEPLAARCAAERWTIERIEKLKTLLEEMKQENSENQNIKVHEINSAFHQEIVEASMNPYLMKIMRELKGLIALYRNAILRNNPERPETAIEEHEAIYHAILDRNGDLAHELMCSHIQNDYFLSMKSYEKTIQR